MSAVLEHAHDPATEATLAAWRAREAEVRALHAGSGLGRPEQFAGCTGMDVFRAMLAGQIPIPPISETLDFILVEAEPGRVQFQGRPRFAHYNPLGTVHGGWIATLLDSAVGCSVHTTLAPGKAYTTLELKVNYVKALTERTPLVRAVGEVIAVGSRVATSEGRLVGPDGTLYAHATTTCLIFDALPPRTATA